MYDVFGQFLFYERYCFGYCGYCKDERDLDFVFKDVDEVVRMRYMFVEV